MRYRLFGFAIVLVLRCNSAYFTVQKRLFCNAKQALLYSVDMQEVM